MALGMSAAKVVYGDILEYMLERGRGKAKTFGYSPDRIEFRQLDAESLPWSLTFSLYFHFDGFTAMVPHLRIEPDKYTNVLELNRFLNRFDASMICPHRYDTKKKIVLLGISGCFINA